MNREGKREADFIKCVVWNKQAENLCKYQSKGKMIAVVGSYRVEQYESSEGTIRYKNYVLVNDIEYLNTKREENDSNTQQITNNEMESNPFKDFGRSIEINPDDIPF